MAIPVTIELTEEDGVLEVCALVRTSAEQVQAARLMERIAPALERFDRAVRKQLDATMRAEAEVHS